MLSMAVIKRAQEVKVANQQLPINVEKENQLQKQTIAANSHVFTCYGNIKKDADSGNSLLFIFFFFFFFSPLRAETHATSELILKKDVSISH